jgi:hypothetical protein
MIPIQYSAIKRLASFGIHSCMSDSPYESQVLWYKLHSLPQFTVTLQLHNTQNIKQTTVKYQHTNLHYILLWLVSNVYL